MCTFLGRGGAILCISITRNVTDIIMMQHHKGSLFFAMLILEWGMEWIVLFNHDVLAHQFMNTSSKFSVGLFLLGVKESQFQGCYEFHSSECIAICKAIVSV